jgi:hypothetical protein
MTVINKIEENIDLEDSEVGKMFLFWNEFYPDFSILGFSSVIENIGVLGKHDRTLKNKTEVVVLSEPTEACHASLGPILVTKILAHDTMWVPTATLKYIDK